MARSGAEVTGASLFFVGALGTKGAGGRGYRGELLQVEGGSPLSILLLGGCRDFWMGWEVDFDCFFRYYSNYTLNMLTPLPVRTARSGWFFCFYVSTLSTCS